MAAVRAPLSASTSLVSAFSPFSERFGSPKPSSATAAPTMMSVANSTLKAPAPDPKDVKSPSTPSVAPSPISSDVGTEFADTEEAVDEREPDAAPIKAESAAREIEDLRSHQSPLSRMRSPNLKVFILLHLARPDVLTLPEVNTSPVLSFNATASEEAEPQSVIHIPSGFGQFPNPKHDEESEPETETQSRESSMAGQVQRPDLERSRADSGHSVRSDSTVTMAQSNFPTRRDDLPLPPTPLQTTLPITQDWSSTPRAQTRSDLGALSRPPSSLASILEGDDVATDYPNESSNDESSVSRRAGAFFRSTEDEIAALRTALSECWTLCNTLASLSYIHRERIFAFPTPSTGSNNNNSMHHHQQQAWKSCWKLCQNLYDSVYPTTSPSPHAYTAPSRPTLDLCRDFCACLFDARARDNETADSVLRVSFELNNHLFNTHDRSLPEAFRERTLDFYITLCHRLMKQKARMQEETDSLLRACWSLAEMLFSLRQNAREGRRPDEELLGSAVQACWELCDLFREGWTQIRPERGTPRPSQTTFTQAYQQAKRAGFGMGVDENGNPLANTALLGLPETPTTIFEDTGTVNVISPDDPPPQPNILVLGADAPSEMALRSTNSTPAPNVAEQMAIRHVPGQPIAQIVHMPPGVNATHAGVTPMPMSAHPGTQRRFWGSASSISAMSEGRGPTSAATGSASTVTRGTHQQQQHQQHQQQAANTAASVHSVPAGAGNGNGNGSHNGPNQGHRVVRSSITKPAHHGHANAHHHGEDPTLLLLKALFYRAALFTDRGFTGDPVTSGDPALSSLPLFVRSLPDTAFGTQVWQVNLLDNYRKAVAEDAAGFRSLAPGVRAVLAKEGSGKAGALETALAVKAMTEGVYGFGWLKDLYRFVWGFYVEEALKAAEGPVEGEAMSERGRSRGRE
ncbi:uncharacterized protein HMPREF1541_01941 [Cyphellophora europaea CBS 101466]|uniref:DUF7624 domain-containing protein n=1 Tax=Cyphellophora europaea (strain CBS 101466) TaxID=1220924 RepID=W2S404_CYPE1|nr:uncharacterized protein HMPREF1541_01941 [Cyphellophora europaea CBS 101466]ETN42783.1 hypothetical protein HMPREF1541_01941 [Cyphellophora europaea CBS 101466]